MRQERSDDVEQVRQEEMRIDQECKRQDAAGRYFVNVTVMQTNEDSDY